MQSIPTFEHYTTLSLNPPLHYTAAGKGATLLLIHGSLCDYRYWRWQMPALSSQARVIAPSLRGYWPTAYTQEDPSFSIAQHASDIAALINELNDTEQVHVLGHSRGAHVALEVARQAPERVRSLTLADPGFRFTGEPTGPSPYHAAAVNLLKTGDAEGALAGFVDAVNGAGTWRQMVSWFKTMVRDNAYTLLSQVREADLSVDLHDVAQLQCPVMLLGGASSPARYHSRLDALQTALPDARRIVIPLASHGMNLANPKAFNSAISDFISSVY